MNEQIVFNGQVIQFRTQGSGPWIVLLHGFLESMEIWTDLANELSDKFSVLMIDLPGHGRSGLLGEEHPMPLMGTAVRAIIGSLNIDSFILCGHSMGGYVSLEIAKEMQDKTKGVILFHSHASPDDEKAKDARTRTVNIVKLNHSNYIHQFIPDLFATGNRERLNDQIERLRNRAASTSGKAIIAALHGMRDREGALDLLLNANFPFLFILGKNDSKMPYDKAMAQAMLARHSELLVLSDVGHMGFLEAPKVIFPVLKHFCERNLLEPVRMPNYGD